MANSRLPSSFDGNTEFYEENRLQKFGRRLKEEPLVPLGCALTCYALYRASRSIRAGDHHTTNRMFRARIYAQAFTLVCIVAGSVYYKEERAKRKEFEGMVAENKVMEKKEAWIRELEARDREEKELKAKKDAARRGKMADTVKVAKVKDEKESQAKDEGLQAKKDVAGHGRIAEIVKKVKGQDETALQTKSDVAQAQKEVGVAKAVLERSERKTDGVLEAVRELLRR